MAALVPCNRKPWSGATYADLFRCPAGWVCIFLDTGTPATAPSTLTSPSNGTANWGSTDIANYCCPPGQNCMSRLPEECGNLRRQLFNATESTFRASSLHDLGFCRNATDPFESLCCPVAHSCLSNPSYSLCELEGWRMIGTATTPLPITDTAKDTNRGLTTNPYDYYTRKPSSTASLWAGQPTGSSPPSGQPSDSATSLDSDELTMPPTLIVAIVMTSVVGSGLLAAFLYYMGCRKPLPRARESIRALARRGKWRQKPEDMVQVSEP